MATTKTFANALLSDNCHQALVDLGDGEIKSLEQIKSYLTKQIGIIDQFVNAMVRLNNSNALSRLDLKENSPFVQIWQVFHSENISVMAVLSQLSGMFSSSILPRLDKLLSYCKDVHKQYKTQRFRIDSEFKTICDEGTRLRNTYEQHATEVKTATQKLEASKSTKGSDKTKEDKLYKASLKLFQNHNDYVLALTSATIHQRHYQDGIIPNLMTSLQTVKNDLFLEWKEICTDMVEHIKSFGEQNCKLSEAVYWVLDSIHDNNPYEKFLQNKGEELRHLPEYTFDESLLQIANTDLEPNEIALYDLTFEQLKSKNSLLEQSVQDTKMKLSRKTTDYQSAKQALQELKETCNSYNSIFHEQMAVADLSREVNELNCLQEKVVAQYGIISNHLEKLNGQPPKTFVHTLLSKSSDSFGPNSVRKSNRTLGRLKDRFVKTHSQSKMIPTASQEGSLDRSHADGSHRPLPETPPEDVDSDEADIDDYDEPVDKPLEDELWYHGTISRVDAETALQNDGDFLVRESSRKPGQYVLSAKWGSYRHFILQQDETCKFKLEGEGFPTVTHLIEYHKKYQCPVTKKSGAILQNPILRSKIQGKSLSHDNIVVTDTLGRGHFGDVMKGLLRDTREEVAIKTCRDNVLPSMKDKFLQEAAILAQYNHPNIVKLIGVAIDKEPVYIVMELMEGGDFLNYLRKHGNETLPGELLEFAIGAASGMDYLESKGCIHRDLAARNCLLDKRKVLKISDFGMSRETDLYECSNMKEIPVKWTAPEALNYSLYTSQSDVWSFGVLLWETYSLGNTPYPGLTNKETREKVDGGYRMPAPVGTPGSLYVLMNDCWEQEAGNRPRFSEIKRRLKNIKDRG